MRHLLKLSVDCRAPEMKCIPKPQILWKALLLQNPRYHYWDRYPKPSWSRTMLSIPQLIPMDIFMVLDNMFHFRAGRATLIPQRTNISSVLDDTKQLLGALTIFFSSPAMLIDPSAVSGTFIVRYDKSMSLMEELLATSKRF